MSALTDLFTAMANKIRSKTGTQTTYTPSEMVSDGIDDVYDAGVASVPTPTSITPSNASPVALTANTAVEPTASGYAIESYSSKTPSDSNPPSISSGDIIKSTASGYLYATQQSGGMTQTTLWTNNSPSQAFAAQAITLSDDIDNYDYIGIKYKVSTAVSNIRTEILITPSQLKNCKLTNNYPFLTIGASVSGYYARHITYSSDTSLGISGATKLASSGSNNSAAIPLNVYGYKL